MTLYGYNVQSPTMHNIASVSSTLCWNTQIQFMAYTRAGEPFLRVRVQIVYKIRINSFVRPWEF